MTVVDPAAILTPLATSPTAWCGFDAGWYRIAYAARLGPLAEADDAALLRHYRAQAAAEALSPNPYFDEAFYRGRNPDVAAALAAGEFTTGYEHYCALGYLSRMPHWLYDDDTYALGAPDLTDQVMVNFGCANRYDHYLKAGAREGRIAHLLFQPAVYVAAITGRADGILDGADNAFQHYLHRLWRIRQDIATSPYFDAAWYLAHCPAARAAIAAGECADALHHFLTAADAGDPLPEFSADFYRASQPEAAQAVAAGRFDSLYDHFLKVGVFALAAPAGEIDLAAYLAATPEAGRAIAAREVRDAFAHRLQSIVRPVPTPVAAAPAADGALIAAGTTAAYGDIEISIESTILCSPDGLLLIGWLLAPPGALGGLRLLGGDVAVPLDPARFVPNLRADVLAKHADAGFEDPNCGFLAFVPGRFAAGERLLLEVRTADGTVDLRAVPVPALHGMPAIRAVLERFDLRYGALAVAMATVVGPAISRLGAAFTAQPVPREVIGHGTPPADPAVSLIVPLHGRLDFMEVQLALFCRDRAAWRHEIIYVLDDPPRRREAETLAASAYARFGLPFRLALARGRHVALVNSDVFPLEADGFDRLAARLDADASLGAVGPLLLFEDGTVQHQGMDFAPQAEFAGWHFPLHRRKGLLPPADDQLQLARAITAACLVMPRALLTELGGLDERFLIGDFEDADLCLKLSERGLTVAVDHGVRMYHLERQSQAGSEQRWRMNLTLYNAWAHERRWGATLAVEASA
jgi:hypothetical protein